MLLPHEVVWMRIGNNKYLVQGTSVSLAREVAETLNIKYDSITPSALRANNGIFKSWTMGELAEFLNNEKILV